MNKLKSAIFTKKLGMLSFYVGKTLIPVTVLQVLECKIVKKNTIERNGYNAVVVNYGKNAKRIPKAMKNYFTSEIQKPKQSLKELRFTNEIYNTINVNDVLSIDQFSAGNLIDATSISIGKGYAGVMKKHNFSGLEASHGVSISHRSQGSTGGCQDPGKVFKGKKMAGQMGNHKVTIQNLSIVKIDKEKNIMLIKGSLPGAKNSTVFVKNAVKQS